jgi:hypothetical protein
MLSGILLSVIKLRVVLMSLSRDKIMLNVIKLRVVMLRVSGMVMLN